MLAPAPRLVYGRAHDLDLKALLKPDQGQPASSLQLVDKKGFEAWLKGQPARVRKRARGAGVQGRGLSARHLARRAGRMGGRARRRQCRGARAPGASPRRRRACPRGPIASPIAGRGPAVLGWLLGQYRFDRYKKEAAAKGPRILLTDEPARIDEAVLIAEFDLPRPRPRQHAGRRSRPGRARGRGARARRSGRRQDQGHRRQGARRGLSDDRRGRPRRRQGPRAAADRAGIWRPAPSPNRDHRQGRLLRFRAGSTSSPRRACG